MLFRSTNLSDVSLSWADKSSFFKTTATFAYTEWEEVTMASNMPAPSATAESTPIISVPASYYSSIAANPTVVENVTNAVGNIANKVATVIGNNGITQ